MVCDGGLGWRVPRTTSDTHDDETRSALRVLAKLLRTEGKDDRVADGFEEEEREETTDASLAGRKRGGHRECRAGDAIDSEEEGGVDPVEQNDTNESATKIKNHSGICPTR